MKSTEYADILLPGIDKNIDYYEKLYPKRNLGNDSMVTRFAPSPTGFVHMGSLYASFISSVFAKQSNGIFYLRIEDTDKKREIENGIEGIINDLSYFDIIPDEGPANGGIYGPYIQSERKEIYQTFAKHLIKNDLAYPCFCSEEENNETRKIQERKKDRLGYYGEFAKCRNLSKEEVLDRIKDNKKYVIRLKSPGDFNNKVVCHDLIKGEITFPENDQDIVMLKSDGLPTYHFAHLVDDHLMRTTHVIRGDEWLSSIPIHLQLYSVFGYEHLKYVHLAPIVKMDGNSKRKLSKRHDPECAISFYHEKGFPKEVIKLYLATLINAGFEDWYTNNPQGNITDYKFLFENMSRGGSLFDLEKIISISRTYFSRLSAEEVYDGTLEYADKYNPSFALILKNQKEYAISVLNIERNNVKPRKDIATYSDVYNETWYMYDELFYNQDKKLYSDIDESRQFDVNLLNNYIDNFFTESDEKQQWYDYISEFAITYGYAPSRSELKENPEKYKGFVGDICEMLRFAITSKTMTPDLYEIMKILGKERLKKRIENFGNFLNKD